MTATGVRQEVLGRIARGLAERARSVPVLRVAVDGLDGAGKATFARELDDLLRPLLTDGAEVRRFTSDEFMVPSHVRRSDVAADPAWLYENAFDLARIREITEGDPDADPPGTVVLVNGMGLQRPELVDLWDLTIYLSVPEEVSLTRYLERYRAEADGVVDGMSADTAAVEADIQLVARLLRERYLPALRLYRDRVDPVACADVLIDMHDYHRPVALRWGSL
ncbi:nucleoside/nucleotide kinase family protein [Georgenia subflava]|uniref:Uridine kinase n=1 Tax=Georgenia subflava TaxID=1622177 RepID=A0A6N7ERX7_9MICO|nr:hypothetical protein [Georgenia subflava]MPV38866.1 hypothetical protein [Georgenia subflava]